MKTFLKNHLGAIPYLGEFGTYLYRRSAGQIIANIKSKQLAESFFTILVALEEAMREAGVEYWIEFGTLLGVHRNNQAIEYDNDIDIGVFFKHRSKELISILENHGFSLDHYFDCETYPKMIEDSFVFDGIGIDIFYFERLSENTVATYDFLSAPNLSREATIKKNGGLTVRKVTLTMNGIKKIKKGNIIVPVPDPVGPHLADHYGKDYMLPNPNWRSVLHANTATLVDGALGRWNKNA